MSEDESRTKSKVLATRFATDPAIDALEAKATKKLAARRHAFRAALSARTSAQKAAAGADEQDTAASTAAIAGHLHECASCRAGYQCPIGAELHAQTGQVK